MIHVERVEAYGIVTVQVHCGGITCVVRTAPDLSDRGTFGCEDDVVDELRHTARAQLVAALIIEAEREGRGTP